MNWLRNILIVAILLAAVEPVVGSVCQVRLNESVVVDAGPVALGMIAEVQAEDQEERQRLESLIVSQVAEGTTLSGVGVYEITRALARANISPNRVDIYGATRCRLEVRRGEIVEPESADETNLRLDNGDSQLEESLEGIETIGEKLRELVARQSGLDAARLKIEWQGKAVESLLGRGFSAERYRIYPRSTMSPGRVLIEVVDREGEGQGKSITFRVRGLVSYLCESVVTTRALTAGEVIGADDVKLLSRRVDDLRDVGIGDLDQVVGQEVSRAMPVNMVLQGSMIKQVELIGRHDMVSVEYNDGRIVLSLQARAEESGCLGDVIKLYDLINKRTFQGRIIGAGQVQILQGELSGRKAEG